MTFSLKDFLIFCLCAALIGCLMIISDQHARIEILEDEVSAGRKFMDSELRLIDSMYQNNYRILDWRVDMLLRDFESRGWLIREGSQESE